MNRRRPHDVAIVGMGRRFPGAGDLFVFWAQVLANREPTDDRAEPSPSSIGDVVESALADAGLERRPPRRRPRRSARQLRPRLRPHGAPQSDRPTELEGSQHPRRRPSRADRRDRSGVPRAQRASSRPRDGRRGQSRRRRRRGRAQATRRRRTRRRPCVRDHQGDRPGGRSRRPGGPMRRAIRRACRIARVKPETVGLIEARGLPAELRGSRGLSGSQRRSGAERGAFRGDGRVHQGGLVSTSSHRAADAVRRPTGGARSDRRLRGARRLASLDSRRSRLAPTRRGPAIRPPWPLRPRRS